jgi:hypothetical protein
VTDDALRDELAEASALAWRSLESERSQGFPVDDNIAGERYGVAVLPVVRRYADAQVTAERERLAETIDVAIALRVRAGGNTQDLELCRDVARGQP